MSRAPRASTTDAGVDTRYLESLLGYNCRRAALAIITKFLERMAVFGLRPVEFSVLTLVKDNPGITSRQICDALGILSPNLVRIISQLDERALLERQPHASDRRAIGLKLTQKGARTMREAQAAATELEASVLDRISAAEYETLVQLLQKIYLPPR